jgi:hypothetical protein
MLMVALIATATRGLPICTRVIAFCSGAARLAGHSGCPHTPFGPATTGHQCCQAAARGDYDRTIAEEEGASRIAAIPRAIAAGSPQLRAPVFIRTALRAAPFPGASVFVLNRALLI